MPGADTTEDSRTTLYFVRHAHSPYVPNRERERGLSRRGRRDASRVAELLARYDVDAVVSSPYARAVETVRETAEAVGTDVITDEGFRERTLAGEHVDDFEAAVAKVWEEPSFSWDGGESNEAARERGVEAVERTLDRWEGKRVAVGTHGNILTLILGHYDEAYDRRFWRRLTMPDIYRAAFRGRGPPQIERIYPDG